jgi:hypothetical protein
LGDPSPDSGRDQDYGFILLGLVFKFLALY